MRLLKSVAPVFAAAALAAGFGSVTVDQSAAQAVKTIRYTHYQPGRLDQPKHAAATAFKAYVEAASGGKIKVEIFPAGQLGNEQTVMEQLALGSIQLAVIHEGGIAGSYKPIMVASLPFLFPDQSVAWKVFDGPFGRTARTTANRPC